MGKLDAYFLHRLDYELSFTPIVSIGTNPTNHRIQVPSNSFAESQSAKRSGE